MSTTPKYYKDEPSIDDLDVDDEDVPREMQMKLMMSRAHSAVFSQYGGILGGEEFEDKNNPLTRIWKEQENLANEIAFGSSETCKICWVI